MTTPWTSRWTAWRWLLLSLAGALFALDVFISVNPGQLVLLHAAEPYRGHVWIGALVLAAVASIEPGRRSALRRLPTVLLAALAVLALCGQWFGGGTPRYAQSVVAQSGDERLQVVLIKTRDEADPVDEMVLRSNEGPLSQRDDIGCFDTDSSPRNFHSARFLAPDRIEIVSGNGESWTLGVDAQAVRMRERMPGDAPC